MLTLPIKKKWFDMILSGEKKEEYRATTRYYTKRFQSVGLLDENRNPTGRFAFICFRNGYGKDRPEFVLMVTLKIGTGYPAWGAEEDEWYYVLEIHALYKEADCRNCKKWDSCPCGKEGHEKGTSIGYSVGKCVEYEPETMMPL